MRVLVVEDDPVSRRIVTATLEGLGHEAVVAEDGQHAGPSGFLKMCGSALR